MIRVSVLYPNVEGSRFDKAYYLSSHMPMLQQKLGSALRGVGVDFGVAGGAPGSQPPYVAMAHMQFDSVEAFQAAFGPHAQAIMADIANYTDVTPALQISDIRM